MKIRLIHYLTEDLSKEEITFTEDFTSDNKDWKPFDERFKLESDKIIFANLPDTFPLEITLKK